MLTSRAKYALRASVTMAELHPSGAWTSAADIAEAADVPRKFLEAILTQLREQGLVESRRGPAGGHRLTAPPASISVAAIIRGIDGPLAMTPCASERAFRACDDCLDMQTCRLRHVMRQARDAAAAVLEHHSLADVLAAAVAKESQGSALDPLGPEAPDPRLFGRGGADSSLAAASLAPPLPNK